MPVVTYRLRSSRKEFWIISNTWRCRAEHGGAWQGGARLGKGTECTNNKSKQGQAGHGAAGLGKARRGSA